MNILHIPTFNPGIAYWRHDVPVRALIRAGHQATALSEDTYNAAMKSHGSIGRWVTSQSPRFDIIHTGFTAQLPHIEMLFTLRQDHGIPFIVDIDDNIDAVEAYNPGYKLYRKGTQYNRIVKMQLKIADGVTVTTPTLREAVEPYNSKVEIVGNWVDRGDWEGLKRDPRRGEDRAVRLMFTGGYGRYGDWNVVREPLERLMARYPQLRLLFMGGTPDWVAQWMPSNVDSTANRAFYIQATYSVALFRRTLAWLAPDIIVSPVLTNAFNASKSGIKAIESAMVGAAFACTDWATYADVPKGTCLKCDNTPTQWEESLAALIEDASLRARLTTAAKEWALGECVIDKHIGKWVDFYEQVVAAGPLKAVAREGIA